MQYVKSRTNYSPTEHKKHTLIPSMMALSELPNRFQVATKCDAVVLCQETAEQSENQKYSEWGREVVYIIIYQKLTTVVFSTFSSQTQAVWS